MTEKKRPNVVGKGPVFSREMIAMFKEIQENTAGLSDDLAGKISAGQQVRQGNSQDQARNGGPKSRPKGQADG